jgi:hypothetical protein
MYPLATVLLASPPSRASFENPTVVPPFFIMTCNNWVKDSRLLPDETTSPKTQSRTIWIKYSGRRSNWLMSLQANVTPPSLLKL